jgi:outer membrane protein assembly factor BamE (lipoprotein component of BamABCDE complex)
MKKIFSKLSVSFLALSFLITSACATKAVDPIKQIQVGMDKSDVLEILGNPTRQSRSLGMDRWTYELDSQSGLQTIYVFFDAGIVRYIGPQQDIQKNAFQHVPVKKDEPKGEFKTISD